MIIIITNIRFYIAAADDDAVCCSSHTIFYYLEFPKKLDWFVFILHVGAFGEDEMIFFLSF